MNVFNASGAMNSTPGTISASMAGATPCQIQFGLKLKF